MLELENLKQSVKALSDQVAETKDAISKLQASTGVSPADVQAQADQINAIVADLKSATPAV